MKTARDKIQKKIARRFSGESTLFVFCSKGHKIQKKIASLGAYACTSHYSKENGKDAGVPRRVVPYARISFLEGGERGGWGCLISVFYSSHSLKGGGYLATANSGSVAGSQVE